MQKGKLRNENVEIVCEILVNCKTEYEKKDVF